MDVIPSDPDKQSALTHFNSTQELTL